MESAVRKAGWIWFLTGLVLIILISGCAEGPPVSPDPEVPGPCLDKDTCDQNPSLDPDPSGEWAWDSGLVWASIPPRQRRNPRLDPSYMNLEIAGDGGGTSSSSEAD